MELLHQFQEFLEKQDMLSKLTESEKLHSYGYSDIHTIAAIGDLNDPTVTMIASYLHMSKGAISKITKKLLSKGIIKSYVQPDNRQKVFFELTQAGKQLYEDHAYRHHLWEQRDERFLQQFSKEQLNLIQTFMLSYNAYLDESIKELEGKNHAD